MASTPEGMYKDKIEVSLDGRQIFYLFFGGAVIVGLVFVLGVMVGKRVEARGHLDRAQTPTATDPLAALDRLEGSAGLTFQTALTGSEPARDVDKTIAAIEKDKAAAKQAAEVAAKLDKKDKKLEQHEAAKKPEDKKLDQHADAKKPDDLKIDKKADDNKTADKKADDKKADRADDKKADAVKPKKHDDAAKLDDKARFTLQLSSFQDKTEADAFISTVKAAGFQPYITEAEVEGKGTFYRVRVGSYRSLDAANDAKSDLDKTLKKPAQVMKL
jgi:cell division protein FtsN